MKRGKWNDSISALDLGTRATKCLRRAGITCIGGLVQASELELLSIRDLGRTTLEEIRQRLRVRGLEVGTHARAIEYPNGAAEDDGLGRSDVGVGDDSDLGEVASMDWNAWIEKRGLTSRDWTVLKGRFGIGRRLKLRELAKELGLTRERVRQIEEKLLSRLWASVQELRIVLEHVDGWFAEGAKSVPVDDGLLKEYVIRTIAQRSASHATDGDVERLIVIVRALASVGVEAVEWPRLSLMAGLLPPPIGREAAVADVLDRRAKAEQEERRQWGYNEVAVEVLRKERAPLHWREITERAESMGRRRSVSASSLYNQLQRQRTVFVRVAQGTYGLVEWGLRRPETINGVIAGMLRVKGGCMAYGEILRLVEARQPVKPVSVKMTLELHPRFYRSVKGRYGLRAWLPDRESQTLRTPRDRVEAADSKTRVPKAEAKGYNVDKLVAEDGENGKDEGRT